MKESQSTQQFVDIEEIRDGTVILKSGSLRRVLMVTGINFELKSEDEQNAILGAYQNFLNSLDFSLQIVIHSRKLNIKGYLDNLSEMQENEKNDLLKDQISEYVEFVKSFVESNEIMSKNFFVVVPYDAINISEGTEKVMEAIPFFGKKKKNASEDAQTLEEKISQLDQRTDEVVAGLSAIGLRAVALMTEELIELFYNLYNPQPMEKKELHIVRQDK